MLIKLSDGCYIAHDHIAEVTVNSHREHIVVRTKDGIGLIHEPGYKQSVYNALDDLVTKINSVPDTKG